MHFGPYIVSQKMVVGDKNKQVVVVEEAKHPKRYTAMLETISSFRESMKQDDGGMGHNKVKGLRHALQADKHTLLDTIEQLKKRIVEQHLLKEDTDTLLETEEQSKKRKTPLPEIKGWEEYSTYGWEEAYIHATRKEGSKFITPYIDAIEVLEYVPQESLQSDVYKEMENALKDVNEIYSSK